MVEDNNGQCGPETVQLMNRDGGVAPHSVVNDKRKDGGIDGSAGRVHTANTLG